MRAVSTWWSRLGRIAQLVLDAWTTEKADFPDYNSGSDADELLAQDGGRVWRKVAQLSEHKT
jgi:glucose-6-phosphate 1-dehydrogenase